MAIFHSHIINPVNLVEFTHSNNVFSETRLLIPLIMAVQCAPEDLYPCRVAVAMGDNMSKRLKLISATEAEMEERSFPNPYPDWDPALVSSEPGADVDHNEPCDAEGKVSRSRPVRPNGQVERGANTSLAQTAHYM